ncbi:hypothetical protein FRB90_012877 [Tulasnella sp. 427]|nr:hypothetical protein FRB90_012877 [Tulasnella sp. 427]
MYDRLAGLSAPQLRKLAVKSHKDTTWYDEGRPTRWKFQPFVRTEAPNLRELNLYGINPTHVIRRFRSVPPDQVDRNVQRRERGHFYNVRGDANTMRLLPHVLPPPITHNALIHASFDASFGADPICSETIMASPVLPKLPYSPFPALITLRLAGGYNPAESITHPRNAINMSNLESALSRLKRLRSLTFDHIDFEGDQYLPCVGWTCPKLEWLRFIACHGFTMKQVRSAVEARQQQDPKKRFRSLVRLVVYRRSPEPPMVFEDGDKEWLDGALKLEMKVHLRDPMAGQDYLGVAKVIRPFDYR